MINFTWWNWGRYSKEYPQYIITNKGAKMEKIKIAIVGIGNCASSLIQGLYYYADKDEKDVDGLMHWSIGGYKPSDIEVVAAIDVDKRKVGKDVCEAVYAKPNCTTIFYPDIKETGLRTEADGYRLK